MKGFTPTYFLILVIVTVLGLMGSNAAVLAQGGGTVAITSPAEGEAVSGLVTVTGTVDFPNFSKYELYLKSGDQMIWVATVFSPVSAGNLARLDSRTLADGGYQIVVRQVGSDSNYVDTVGPTFTINNGLDAPLPYAELESNPLYPVPGSAIARIRNCSDDDLTFDYNSPAGFCSSGDLPIVPKAPDNPICPFVDVLLTPCEYRGTAKGLGSEGTTYSFQAEAGKLYEIIYPGGDQLALREIAADPAGSTDTAAPESGPPPAAPAPGTAPPAAKSSLPVSGAVRPVSDQTLFAAASLGLLLLLIGWGVVVAVSKRDHPT